MSTGTVTGTVPTGPADPAGGGAGDGPVSALADLAARQDAALHAGTASAVARHRARGKLTARERVDLLFDPGTFVELDAFVQHRTTAFDMATNRPYGDGVVTGHGLVDGRPVAVYAQDFTVFGGSMGEAHGEKVVKVMDLALKIGCPIVGISDSGGARIQEGVVALAYYAELIRRNVTASGVIPQVSMILGSCAGGAVYSPAITDFVVVADGISHMFVTGPDVVERVTGERVSFEELGGARTSAAVSGNAHHLAADEPAAFDYVRDLLSYLPANNLEDPPGDDGFPVVEPDPVLDTLVPEAPNRAYDMRPVLERVLDAESFLEVQELFAPNLICGFGRVAGRVVGVVANQPLHLAGCLDIDASEKAARFIRTCDAFNVPLLMLVDVPGYLPGTDQERAGIIRRGAKLVYAYAEATVPKVTVVVRKAYGGGYGVMGSKHLGADVNLAWPTARIAVLGADSAVDVLYRKELAASDDPPRLRRKLVDEYERTLTTPYLSASRGYLDAVIRPADTPVQVARALWTLRTKRVEGPPKKHGNIPL